MRSTISIQYLYLHDTKDTIASLKQKLYQKIFL